MPDISEETLMQLLGYCNKLTRMVHQIIEETNQSIIDAEDKNEDIVRLMDEDEDEDDEHDEHSQESQLGERRFLNDGVQRYGEDKSQRFTLTANLLKDKTSVSRMRGVRGAVCRYALKHGHVSVGKLSRHLNALNIQYNSRIISAIYVLREMVSESKLEQLQTAKNKPLRQRTK